MRRFRRPLTFPTLLLTALAGAPAAAQYGEPLDMLTASLDHPSGYVTDLATDVELGRFSDDAIPDALVLHGDVAYLVYAPDRRNGWLALEGVYTSLARLSGGPATGGRDVAVAIGGAGLVLLAWDPATRTLVPEPVPGTDVWVGASELLERDGELVAIRPGANGVLRAAWDPGQGVLQMLADVSTTYGSVSAVALVDLAPAPGNEIAVAGPTGLEVLAQDGTPVLLLPDAGTGHVLVAIPDAGPSERLAWIRSPLESTDHLTVVRPDGQQEPAIWFGGCDVAQALAVDLGDGPEGELLLVGHGFPSALALRRASSGPSTFTGLAGPAFDLDLTRAASRLAGEGDPQIAPGTGSLDLASGTTAPVLAAADLDGDGDADVFAAGHPGQADRAMIHFGTIVDEELSSLKERRARAWLPRYEYLYDAVAGRAVLTFTPPPAPTHAESPALSASHVQVVVWRQVAGEPYLDRTPLEVLRWPKSDSDLKSVALDGPTVIETSSHLHLEMSYVKLDASGSIVAAFPAYHETLELAELDADVPYVFEDSVLSASLLDGTGSSGSTQRPPITPPEGGGGGNVGP